MEVNIRIAGAAGQGMQTTAELLGRMVTRSGLFVHAYTDAESRIRGGLNFSHLRLAAEPRAGVKDEVDILVAQTEEALKTYGDHLTDKGVAVVQDDWPHPRKAPFLLGNLAQEAGSIKTAGTAAAAAAAAMIGLERDIVIRAVQEAFAPRPKLLEVNLEAARKGFEAGAGFEPQSAFRLPGESKGLERMFLAGHQAVALGAVAGGVGFVAGYPMSPATGILVDLAAWSPQAGVLVEQAEDEVAAINMVAGAAFAGARAMTATSGGGFALMGEGVSLLGMIEAPAVIVLAQRPGPATGLPTRLAQGDLNLVRHAGHGFFPRIILAPRDIADCFTLTAEAFDLAERFQAPVIILTDQHLQDGQMTLEPFDATGLPRRRHHLTVEEAEKLDQYKRYAWDDSGVSPFAPPGLSRHVVAADSDEHDEEGHITESAAVADQMTAKRLAKAGSIQNAAWELEVAGEVAGQALVVSFGSTYHTLVEARKNLAAEGLSCAHLNLRWLWPLPEDDLAPLLARAAKIIVVENSVGGELVGVLREKALRKVDALINRRDGRPFNVDELTERLGEEVSK